MSALRFEPATSEDAPALAALHTRVADELTRRHGRGPWSSHTSERGVLLALRTAKVWVGRQEQDLVSTLRLATRKPWAIDTRYFTPCPTPLYLLGLAVAPSHQGQGLGRQTFAAALELARAWPADWLRLDAYAGAAGAGPFYARCGCAERGQVTYRKAPLIYYEFHLESAEPPLVATRRKKS